MLFSLLVRTSRVFMRYILRVHDGLRQPVHDQPAVNVSFQPTSGYG